MEALDEPGPFICLGSMDGGHDRCYQYALDHPDKVLSVVAVSGVSPYNEFTSYAAYYNESNQSAIDKCRETSTFRRNLANLYGFFPVAWGLMPLFVPSGDYQPADRAHESHFLNLFNEKQWQTQASVLDEAARQTNCGSFMTPSIYQTAPNMPHNISVILFELARTEEQLNQQCQNNDYSLDSQDCAFIFWQYNQTVTFLESIVARNPTKNVLVLASNCSCGVTGTDTPSSITSSTGNGEAASTPGDCGDNGFALDQNENIAWFAEVLISLVGDLTK